MAGREINQGSERDYIRIRYQTLLGADMPKTISVKECLDNGLDQIADDKTNIVNIKITNNSVIVMDGGAGISLKKAKNSNKTNLYLAVAKLYTSTNTDYKRTNLNELKAGKKIVTGNNGVGATITNFVSSIFKSGIIKDGIFTGYIFKDGMHANDGEKLDIIENFDSPFNNGFYVEAQYDKTILEDPIDINWIINYIKCRVGELKEDSIVSVEVEGLAPIEFNKNINSPNYVKSWEESINEIPGAQIIIAKDGWKYAFAKEKDSFKDIKSMVHGAPVQNNTNIRNYFEIEDYTTGLTIPCSFYYTSKKYPSYSDQTKVKIKFSTVDAVAILKKSCQSIYNYFYKKAEESYLAQLLKAGDHKTFWPSSGLKKNLKQELIISEGFSAASGIKSMRDPDYQAILGLMGKILNVMSKSLKDAMKSVVITEILTILNKYDYDKIIIAADADTDGNHIVTLLLGFFSRFASSYLEEGKVYYCHTPLYVFNKRGNKNIQWSDKASDCPEGFHVSVKKGLGGLEPHEIKSFITNPETRDLWKIEYDNPEADKMLEFALVSGGEDWIK